MIGKNIRKIRKMNDYTQNDIAKILSVARSTYAHYEDETIPITGENLSKLANFYNISIDELIGREDIIKSSTQQKTNSNEINYSNNKVKKL